MYVLLSGDPSNAPAGASNTIVAYMPDAPTRGGVVALPTAASANIDRPGIPEHRQARKVTESEKASMAVVTVNGKQG